MAIFMKASLPGVTTAQYDALNAELRSLPGDTFAGCLSHVCVPAGSGIEVYDLWESQEAMDKFGAVMMPVAEKQGLPAASERPAVSEVHRYWLPGS
ncbi:hypothetical protein OG345_30580 [Streptomyces sp. NBC_01220]|uniref:hypothetical protein n=1 Tax=unclassified Streptomyces TaxID=2593676 RepID=UPI002E2D81DE|nr:MULTISPECIES: hypothetical protein [unclassified Streptomyces]WSQ47025.1 hypothetical protein OG345_30580 [Streptomyces sp. NBC_01220]